MHDYDNDKSKSARTNDPDRTSIGFQQRPYIDGFLTGGATTIGTLSKADNGSRYVLYNAVLKNIDVKNLTVNPYWFNLRLSNASSVGLELFAWAEVTGRFPLTNGTQPRDTVNGTIVFQVPQTATPVAITYYDLTYNVTANL